ncbi:MAG TPA: BMP family ABC transporter substrate-binding protein [Pseudonocardiaceae bacterium]|nr:BMP family ABC transporter substrate-binding protein [Pseudonocardiaceae bacterium]
MPVRGMTVVAGLVAVGLVLAGCGTKPTSSGSGSSTSNSGSGGTSSFNACMVTDTGGIDDRSFNASAWAGMQAAKNKGKASVKYVQSNTENDYVPNITAFTKQNCNLIVTVGGLMGPATTNASTANPSQHFAIVDSAGNGTNVQGLQFNTAQAGFLAGYLAAGYSKTGKVATFGGQKIAPVTIYMDGYWEGVQYYNSKNGKNVAVLGWDEKSQNGSFTNSFTDQTQGTQLANNFINQGADVIFPVAGSSGLGGVAAASSSGGKANAIWVDTDGCTSAPQYCNVFLSTAFKNVDNAVENSVEQASGGTFATKDYIGTLANGGVGLAPYHQFASKIPQALQDQIKQLQQDIISGKITITSPSQPKSS